MLINLQKPKYSFLLFQNFDAFDLTTHHFR